MSFRDALLGNGATCRVQPVETPHGTVYIREMTVAEKEVLEKYHTEHGRIRGRMLQMLCVKEDGQPEFTAGDIRKIDQLPLPWVDPIVKAIIALNQLDEQEAEQIRKN
jgi:hypothetical protein